jgi:hypothetical protein
LSKVANVSWLAINKGKIYISGILIYSQALVENKQCFGINLQRCADIPSDASWQIFVACCSVDE